MPNQEQSPSSEERSKPRDFIRDIVAGHVSAKTYPEIVTRFPPEPNGYLHLGHAKSICLNYGIALENAGSCHLRMDDTNPSKESTEFVNSISNDVRWLIEGWAPLTLKRKNDKPVRTIRASGEIDFEIGGCTESNDDAVEPFFASDYFEALYEFALMLIRKGKAYVCHLTPEETDRYRGAPDSPGTPSPYRDRPVAENLELFAQMNSGKFPDGFCSLRAKIDMASTNMWLRDPLLYRIRHVKHHRTGDKWCIYPLYDYAHCLSDYIEGISHSICTLEFSDHRALYDWILLSLDLPRPRPHQYEFAKLRLSYTVFSKRRLLQLVESKVVTGWDDPRMPTIAGARRLGVPASALRDLAYNIGITKFESLTDLALYEHTVRLHLNRTAVRRLAVLKPIKIVLTNIGADATIEYQAFDNPQDESPIARTIRLTREVFIEADDFAELPPPKFFRLTLGGYVRLKYACVIRCDKIEKDQHGRIIQLLCTAEFPEGEKERKTKGVIHWVSATACVPAEVNLFERLFTADEPDADEFLQQVNPQSQQIVHAFLEPALAKPDPKQNYQFERLGYFIADSKLHSPTRLVFNRTITLKDTNTKPLHQK